MSNGLVSTKVASVVWFIIAFMNPDFSGHAGMLIYQGLIESLTMTLTQRSLVWFFSIPFGLGAAKNLAQRQSTYFCLRGFHFYGQAYKRSSSLFYVLRYLALAPFAGLSRNLRDHRLSYQTVCWWNRSHWPSPSLQCVRLAQAGCNKWTMPFQAQVMPRFIGLSMYRLDISFRESAVIGIVGAGGILAQRWIQQWTATVQRRSRFILLIIIVIVIFVNICRPNKCVSMCGKERPMSTLNDTPSIAMNHFNGSVTTVNRVWCFGLAGFCFVALTVFCMASREQDFVGTLWLTHQIQLADISSRMWPPRWSYLEFTLEPVVGHH